MKSTFLSISLISSAICCQDPKKSIGDSIYNTCKNTVNYLRHTEQKIGELNAVKQQLEKTEKLLASQSSASPAGQPPVIEIHQDPVEIINKIEIEPQLKTNFEKLHEVVSLTGNAIIIAKGSYDLYYGIRYFVAPTKEQKLQSKQVDDLLAALDENKRQRMKQRAREQVEEKLTICLINNYQGQKNSWGMPCMCDAEVKEFQRIAGLAAFNQMKQNFNDLTKNC